MICALHPSIEGNPKSYLTAKANSGQKDLVMQNAAEFVAAQYVVMGEPTQEQTEIGKISSISGSTITLVANLGFTHPENTKITYIKYNQVKFYKATTETGSYSLQSTKDIAIDEPHTLYDDSAGLSTDYYKIKYYNSTTTDLSAYSSAMPAGGFARYSLISLQNALFKRYGDKKESFLDRDEMTDWINEAKDDMINRLAENNEKQFITSATFPVTRPEKWHLPDNFKKFQKVEMSYTGVSTNRVRAEELILRMWTTRMSPTARTIPDTISMSTFLDTCPKERQASEYTSLTCSKVPTSQMISDLLPKPVRFYTHAIMDYLMCRAFQKDAKSSEADMYLQKYELGCERMIEHENNLVLDENREIREFSEDYLYV